MPMIQDKDKTQIRRILAEKMKHPVTLVIFSQEFECDYCRETRELAEEISSLSDKIKLETYDLVKDAEKAKEYGVDKIPATIVIGERDYQARYFGIPAGYEFSSLIDDIIDASQRTTRLSDETKRRLKEIKKPVHIQVFVTPTCPYCPRAVRTAHQFAMENPLISADMVEATEFPQLSNKYEVMAVPKIVINENISFEGALPETHFLEQIGLALEERNQA